MPTPPPPRRRLGNIEPPDAEKIIKPLVQRFDTAALKICRSNSLGASHRTCLETSRNMIQNTSALVVTNYPPTECTKMNCKQTAFVHYASYWMGQLRTLRNAYENEQRFKQIEWEPFNAAIELIEDVADFGLCAIRLYTDELKNEHFVRRV